MAPSDSSSDHTVEPPARARRVYLIVLLAAVALYWATSQRGVAWQDSGMHQLRVLNGEYTNPLGLALAHPLLIAMGQPLRIVGEANLPTALNMLSGLGMAVAVANVYLLGHRLTGRHVPAVAAASLLAVGHTAWWLATITETYCWVVAGLTTELLLVHSLIARPRWWTAAALALVNGLGLSLHNFALLPLGVYVVAVVILIAKRRMSVGALAASIVAWLAGAGVLLGLVIAQGAATGEWVAAIQSALFGASWRGDVLAAPTSAPVTGAMCILLNWPFASLVPVLVGWALMLRRAGRGFGAVLIAVAAIHLLFAIRYPVPDQFMFLLPTHALLAVGAAVGLARIGRMVGRRREIILGAVAVSLVLTPVLYGVTPAILQRTGRSIRPGRSWPYRDENRYWITPWKFNEQSADRFARMALDVAEPDAEILPAGMATPPLQVLQRATGYRRDVRVLLLGADLVAPGAAAGDDLRNYLTEQVVYAVAADPVPIPAAWRPHVRTDQRYPLVRIEYDD